MSHGLRAGRTIAHTPPRPHWSQPFHQVDALRPVRTAWCGADALADRLARLAHDPPAASAARQEALAAVLLFVRSPQLRRTAEPAALYRLQHALCRAGAANVLRPLTRQLKLDPRREPAETRNSFCIAIEAGRLAAARELADAHRLTVRDVRLLRCWPLRIACGNGGEAMVRWLLDRFPFHARDVRVFACDALRRAAANGQAAVLRLLRQRFKLTTKDAQSRSNDALRHACAGGHAAAVRVLLEDYGLGLADVADCDAAAVRWAVDGRHAGVVAVLRDAFGLEAVACLYSASALPDGVDRALVGLTQRRRRRRSSASPSTSSDSGASVSSGGADEHGCDAATAASARPLRLPPSQLGGGGLPRRFGAPKPRRSSAKSDSLEDRLFAGAATAAAREEQRPPGDDAPSLADAVFLQALTRAASLAAARPQCAPAGSQPRTAPVLARAQKPPPCRWVSQRAPPQAV